jgi:hypothetical protein
MNPLLLEEPLKPHTSLSLYIKEPATKAAMSGSRNEFIRRFANFQKVYSMQIIYGLSSLSALYSSQRVVV